MKAWKCTVCNYVHKGEFPRKNARYAELTKANLWKYNPLMNRINQNLKPMTPLFLNLKRPNLRHLNPYIRRSPT